MAMQDNTGLQFSPAFLNELKKFVSGSERACEVLVRQMAAVDPSALTEVHENYKRWAFEVAAQMQPVLEQAVNALRTYQKDIERIAEGVRATTIDLKAAGIFDLGHWTVPTAILAPPIPNIPNENQVLRTVVREELERLFAFPKNDEADGFVEPHPYGGDGVKRKIGF